MKTKTPKLPPELVTDARNALSQPETGDWEALADYFKKKKPRLADLVTPRQNPKIP